MIDVNECRRAAERAIADVIEALENETGQLVSSVSLVEIDITAIGDTAPQKLMAVEIRMLPIPGHRWK